MLRDIAKGQALTYADVRLDESVLSVQIRRKQNLLVAPAPVTA